MAIIGSLKLPGELGIIQDQYLPLEPNKVDRLVIYVQGAHTNFDSESNTKRIIEYFEKHYGLHLVLLEGGEGSFNNLFFKSFPDKQLKEKVLNDYLLKGELSGGEVASILNETYDTKYFGIETRALYEENKTVFLEAIQNEKEILRLLGSIEAQLSNNAKLNFSENTKTFWQKHDSFQKEEIDLLEYLKVLSSLRGNVKDYPELSKLLSAQSNEERFKDEDLNVAMTRTIQTFRQKVLPRLPKEKQMEMNQMIQMHQLGYLGQGMLLKRIHHLSKEMNFNFETPKVLKPTVKHAQTLSTIKGTDLFRQLEALEEELRKTLPQSKEEHNLVADFYYLELLKNFARLEIVHKNWQEINQIKSDDLSKSTSLRGGVSGQAEAISERRLLRRTDRPAPENEAAVSRSNNRRRPFGTPRNDDKLFDRLNELFTPHFRFYELALKRDDALFQNMLQRMNEEKSKLTLVSTGGFHSEGITQKLKAQKIPYLLIAPKISQVGDRSIYLNVMEGKRSYMKYFSGNLWDALAQDYASKLAASLKVQDLTPSLKMWRDRIIQNSIAEGTITQAAQYTKYVDALVQALRKQHEKDSPFQGASQQSMNEDEIRKALKKELDSYFTSYFNQIEAVLNRKLNIFSSGLKAMWKDGSIKPERINQMLDQMSSQSHLAESLVLTGGPVQGGEVLELAAKVSAQTSAGQGNLPLTFGEDPKEGRPSVEHLQEALSYLKEYSSRPNLPDDVRDRVSKSIQNVENRINDLTRSELRKPLLVEHLTHSLSGALEFVHRDSEAWIIFADMMKLNLRDIFYGRRAADYFISNAIWIAQNIVSKYGGIAYRIGDRADEVAIVLPSRFEAGKVESIVKEIQRAIEKASNRLGFAHLIDDLDERKISKLMEQKQVITIEKLPRLSEEVSGEMSPKETYAVLFEKSSVSTSEKAFNQIVQNARLKPISAEITEVLPPYLPAGAVRFLPGAGTLEERLQKSLSEAEKYQGIAKDRGLVVGVQGKIQLRKTVREIALFGAEVQEQLDVLTKQLRKLNKAYLLEPEYPVFKRSDLIRILRNSIRTKSKKSKIYIIRGPPDNFYIWIVSKGKWQLILVKQAIKAIDPKLEDEFNKLQLRSGRRGERGKFGFKIINDYFGHLAGNQLIKLDALHLLQNFEAELSDTSLAVPHILRALHKSRKKINSTINQKGFSVEFEATIMSSDDLDAAIPPSLTLELLERLSSVREVPVIQSNKTYPGIRIKSYQRNKRSSVWSKIEREVLLTRAYKRKRALPDLRAAQEHYSSKASARAETRAIGNPFGINLFNPLFNPSDQGVSLERERPQILPSGRSEMRSDLIDVLEAKGIDPNEFTTVVYPAAGNYDAHLLAVLKLNVFPKINEYHLNSLSYDPAFGGSERAGERVKDALLNYLQAVNPEIKSEDIKIGINRDDYLKAQFNFESTGRRIWIDKWPGDLRTNKEFYPSTLRRGIVRPGDIILVLPSNEPIKNYPIGTEIGSQIKIPGYEKWDNWSVHQATEDDFKADLRARAEVRTGTTVSFNNIQEAIRGAVQKASSTARYRHPSLGEVIDSEEMNKGLTDEKAVDRSEARSEKEKRALDTGLWMALKINDVLLKLEQSGWRDTYARTTQKAFELKLLSETEAKEVLKNLESSGSWDLYAPTAQKAFELKFLSKTEAKEATQKALENLESSRSWHSYARTAQEAFELKLLSKTKAKEATQKALKNLESSGLWHSYAQTALKAFELKLLSKTEAKEATQKALRYLESSGSWDSYARTAQKAFELKLLSETEAKEVLKNLESSGSWDLYARTAQKAFEQLIPEEVHSQIETWIKEASTNGLPQAYFLGLKRLELALNLDEALVAAIHGLGRGFLQRIEEVNQQAQAHQKIDFGTLTRHHSLGLAHLQVISGSLAAQVVKNAADRGFLPLLEDQLVTASALEPPFVLSLREYYQSDKGRHYLSYPDYLLQLIGFALAFETLGLSDQDFRTLLLGADSHEALISNLGRKVLDTLAHQLDIPIGDLDLQEGSQVLSEWDLDYLGLLVSSRHLWSQEDARYFKLILRFALEGRFRALFDPEHFGKLDLSSLDEETREAILEIRRHNLSLLKEAHQKGILPSSLLHPRNVVPQKEIAGEVKPVRAIDLLRELYKRYHAFLKWQKEAQPSLSWDSETLPPNWNNFFFEGRKPLEQKTGMIKENLPDLLKNHVSALERQFPGQIPEAVADLAQTLDMIERFRKGEKMVKTVGGLSLQFWNRIPGQDAFVGNCAGSCTALGRNATAIFEFLLDLGTQYVLISDQRGNVTGYARFFLAINESEKPLLYVDSMDGRDAIQHRQEILDYIKDFARVIGLSRDQVEDRTSGTVARKLGGALTEHYFHHSGASIPKSSPSALIDSWDLPAARAEVRHRIPEGVVLIGENHPRYEQLAKAENPLMVLARMMQEPSQRGEAIVPLMMIRIPISDLRVRKELEKAGLSPQTSFQNWFFERLNRSNIKTIKKSERDRIVFEFVAPMIFEGRVIQQVTFALDVVGRPAFSKNFDNLTEFERFKENNEPGDQEKIQRSFEAFKTYWKEHERVEPLVPMTLVLPDQAAKKKLLEALPPFKLSKPEWQAGLLSEADAEERIKREDEELIKEVTTELTPKVEAAQKELQALLEAKKNSFIRPDLSQDSIGSLARGIRLLNARNFIDSNSLKGNRNRPTLLQNAGAALSKQVIYLRHEIEKLSDQVSAVERLLVEMEEAIKQQDVDKLQTAVSKMSLWKSLISAGPQKTDLLMLNRIEEVSKQLHQFFINPPALDQRLKDSLREWEWEATALLIFSSSVSKTSPKRYQISKDTLRGFLTDQNALQGKLWHKIAEVFQDEEPFLSTMMPVLFDVNSSAKSLESEQLKIDLLNGILPEGHPGRQTAAEIINDLWAQVFEPAAPSLEFKIAFLLGLEKAAQNLKAVQLYFETILYDKISLALDPGTQRYRMLPIPLKFRPSGQQRRLLHKFEDAQNIFKKFEQDDSYPVWKPAIVTIAQTEYSRAHRRAEVRNEQRINGESVFYGVQTSKHREQFQRWLRSLGLLIFQTLPFTGFLSLAARKTNLKKIISQILQQVQRRRAEARTSFKSAEELFGKSSVPDMLNPEAFGGALAQTAQADFNSNRMIDINRLQIVSKQLENLGLGSVLKNIAYTRTRIQNRSGVHIYLAKGLAFIWGSDRSPEMRMEVLIPDFPKGSSQSPIQIPDVINVFYPRVVFQAAAQTDRFKSLDEKTQQAIRGIVNLVPTKLPLRNETTLTGLMEAGIFHEIGEAIFIAISANAGPQQNDAEIKTLADQLYREWEALSLEVTPGVILAKNAFKQLLNSDDQMFTNNFSDKFVLYAFPRSIYKDFGERLSEKERNYFDRVKTFLQLLEQKKGSMFSIPAGAVLTLAPARIPPRPSKIEKPEITIDQIKAAIQELNGIGFQLPKGKIQNKAAINTIASKLVKIEGGDFTVDLVESAFRAANVNFKKIKASELTQKLNTKFRRAEVRATFPEGVLIYAGAVLDETSPAHSELNDATQKAINRALEEKRVITIAGHGSKDLNRQLKDYADSYQQRTGQILSASQLKILKIQIEANLDYLRYDFGTNRNYFNASHKVVLDEGDFVNLHLAAIGDPANPDYRAALFYHEKVNSRSIFYYPFSLFLFDVQWSNFRQIVRYASEKTAAENLNSESQQFENVLRTKGTEFRILPRSDLIDPEQKSTSNGIFFLEALLSEGRRVINVQNIDPDLVKEGKLELFLTFGLRESPFEVPLRVTYYDKKNIPIEIQEIKQPSFGFYPSNDEDPEPFSSRAKQWHKSEVKLPLSLPDRRVARIKIGFFGNLPSISVSARVIYPASWRWMFAREEHLKNAVQMEISGENPTAEDIWGSKHPGIIAIKVLEQMPTTITLKDIRSLRGKLYQIEAHGLSAAEETLREREPASQAEPIQQGSLEELLYNELVRQNFDMTDLRQLDVIFDDLVHYFPTIKANNIARVIKQELGEIHGRRLTQIQNGIDALIDHYAKDAVIDLAKNADAFLIVEAFERMGIKAKKEKMDILRILKQEIRSSRAEARSNFEKKLISSSQIKKQTRAILDILQDELVNTRNRIKIYAKDPIVLEVEQSYLSQIEGSINEVNREFPSFSKDIGLLIQYLQAHDHPTEFQDRLRKEILQMLGPEAKDVFIIFPNTDDSLVWSLTGSSLIILDPETLHMELPIGSHSIFSDEKGRIVRVLFLRNNINNLETLYTLAHEIAHSLQSFKAISLMRSPLVRSIVEGYQQIREVDIVYSLATRRTKMGQEINQMIKKGFKENIDKKNAAELLAALFRSQRIEKQRHMTLKDKIAKLREIDHSAYLSETMLVELLLKYFGEQGKIFIETLYSNGDIRPFRKALGQDRFKALETLFNDWNSFLNEMRISMGIFNLKPEAFNSFPNELARNLILTRTKYPKDWTPRIHRFIDSWKGVLKLVVEKNKKQTIKVVNEKREDLEMLAIKFVRGEINQDGLLTALNGLFELNPPSARSEVREVKLQTIPQEVAAPSMTKIARELVAGLPTEEEVQRLIKAYAPKSDREKNEMLQKLNDEVFKQLNKIQTKITPKLSEQIIDQLLGKNRSVTAEEVESIVKEKLQSSLRGARRAAKQSQTGIASPDRPSGTGELSGRPPLNQPAASFGMLPHNDGEEITRFQKIATLVNQYQENINPSVLQDSDDTLTVASVVEATNSLNRFLDSNSDRLTYIQSQIFSPDAVLRAADLVSLKSSTVFVFTFLSPTAVAEANRELKPTRTSGFEIFPYGNRLFIFNSQLSVLDLDLEAQGDVLITKKPVQSDAFVVAADHFGNSEENTISKEDYFRLILAAVLLSPKPGQIHYFTSRDELFSLTSAFIHVLANRAHEVELQARAA